MARTVLDTLIQVEQLIHDPDNWSGCGYGEDGQRCIEHAIDTALPGRNSYYDRNYIAGHAVQAAIAIAAGVDVENYGHFLGAWNDESPHSVVLAAVHKAIVTAGGTVA